MSGLPLRRKTECLNVFLDALGEDRKRSAVRRWPGPQNAGPIWMGERSEALQGKLKRCYLGSNGSTEIAEGGQEVLAHLPQEPQCDVEVILSDPRRSPDADLERTGAPRERCPHVIRKLHTIEETHRSGL